MTQTAVVFKGTPEDLAVFINDLITDETATINIVIPTKENGGYLIVYSA